MRYPLILSALLALAAPISLAQTSTWNADPAHSEVTFKVSHMGVSTVRGSFRISSAIIVYDGADPSKSSVNATIDVTSLDTGESARDTDVKGAQWFDITTYPSATFTSTSVSKAGDHLTVNGNLTLHGVTKPVVLEVDGPTGPISGMDHKPHAGFSATTTIDRAAFGIASKFPAAMVGNEIKLEIDLEVVKQ